MQGCKSTLILCSSFTEAAALVWRWISNSFVERQTCLKQSSLNLFQLASNHRTHNEIRALMKAFSCNTKARERCRKIFSQEEWEQQGVDTEHKAAWHKQGRKKYQKHKIYRTYNYQNKITLSDETIYRTSVKKRNGTQRRPSLHNQSPARKWGTYLGESHSLVHHYVL